MPQYPDTIALSALNGTNGFVLPGLITGDRTGNAVSSAGDVNGDGFDDFLVAASSSSTVLGSGGVVYVVFGKDTAFGPTFDFALLDGTNGFRIDPAAAGDDIGTSVASAGDLNGDGFGDIIIGAASADPSGDVNAGAAYVIYGQSVFASATLAVADLDGANGVTMNGIDPADLAGTAVGGGGDFNGDGLDDFLIGAPVANSGEGETYIIFGNNTFGLPITGDLSAITGTGGLLAGVRLGGGAAPSSSGKSADFIGDINADGFDDVIFGAPDTNANSLGSSGSAYVVFGSNSFAGTAILPGSLDGTNGFRIDGVVPFDDTGFSVASAGDFNADGIADMIIGAPGSATGKAYVVFGKSTAYASVLDLTTLAAADGFVITGLNAFDLFGESVASAGDVNGDGYDDIIVGARAATTAGGSGSGESYVNFGTGASFGTTFDVATLDGTNGFRILGAAASDRSGKSVASAGDINGDGLDDLLIGANQAGGGGVRGAAYVLLGQLPDTAVNRVGTGASQSIVGGNLDDILEGSGGDDELWGHDGLDQLDGGTGNDILRGGAGNDLYIVDSLFDQIIEAVSGGAVDRVRSDSLSIDLGNYANVENAFLVGTASLNLTGNGGVNRLDGNDGANTLDGKGGADQLFGGKGNDIYYTDGLDTISEAAFSAGGGVDTMYSSVSNTIALNVEFLRLLGSANINGTGGAASDAIVGNTGKNTLTGNGGNDTLKGGAGGDTLNGGTGADILEGGTGNDTYVTDGLDTIVEAVFSAGGGIDTLLSAVTITMMTNVEILRLQGDAAINGTGTAAQDTIFGNDASNTLSGGGSNDIIKAGFGHDILIGGAGSDTLFGEIGNDTFKYNSTTDSRTGSTNRDTISSFVRGEDKIDLSAIDANPFTSADSAFRFLGTAAFGTNGAASAGQVRVLFVTGNVVILDADVHGDGVSDMQIVVTGQIVVNGLSTLTAADFVL